ncbi:DUF3152 domain-containing protein [Streptomyces sp. NBC_00291]|uniref:DUF3152 domain-containing protein n=1 Tax=Streptomyces sp. NBC_00291 TaxID=2975704 RepID=UPI00225471DF|nr:DUF3152 domain-containing protein [Streptomyces sp. NBC_00291]MCX5154936.1 DUF3152 domain-containing protein [Streptomyces sp. NBC_00291]
MGRHSRKDSVPERLAPPAEPTPFEAFDPPGVFGDSGPQIAEAPALLDEPGAFGEYEAPAPRRAPPPYVPQAGAGPAGRRVPEPTVTHRGFASPAPQAPRARPAGHPEQREPGGAWGASAFTDIDTGSVFVDRPGVPRARTAAPPARNSDTPAFGTPAVGFPKVTVAPAAASPAADPGEARVATGAQGLIPGPRTPEAAPEAGGDTPEKPAAGRGRKIRAYTGVAAAAVTAVLAVVVATQVLAEGEAGKGKSQAGPEDSQGRAVPGQSPASRSDDRLKPDAPAPAPVELTYDQKMALQLPIDAKLAGPGAFDTVPGVAKAPGKGKLVRYRVDVEQKLGLDAQLFAEAVHRTLNDPRSWGHNGAMTFERVPGGEADFVITLASPGTTGVWCAKSGLDTTVDNVSCDSASTERVMINAFRWAQGSPTYGAGQMFAYRQMLINHEVGHRLGHGHVNCRTPGELAPIMQQQTKSLNIDNIQCKPNQWVFPGS